MASAQVAFAPSNVATPFLASLDVPKDTVGDRVTLALKRSGMEDGQVADKANVGARWLSAVKNDRIKNPPLDKLRAVAKVCRVPGRFLTEPLGCIPVDEVEAAPDLALAISDHPRWDDATKQALLRIVQLADAVLEEPENDGSVAGRKRHT